MHDDLGARLTEIRFMSEMAQKNSAEKAPAVLLQVSEVTKEIIAKFSEIVWSVIPQNDTIENLAEFIGQYVVEYLSQANIRCRLDLPDEFPEWIAPSELRHNVFLAVTEALNNTVKYAETEEINIKVSVENKPNSGTK